MKEFFSKIESSFSKATKGEESLSNLIQWWGIGGYFAAYFVAEKLVKFSDLRFFDAVISIVTAIYFAWHIYALKKCSPKKPQLTKEEKEAIKRQNRHQFGKKFLRKLFLQEPLGEWNPVLMSIVVDIFCIAHFLTYVIRL